MSKTTILGNSSLGIFAFATDKYTLVPHGMKDSHLKTIQETLENKIIETSIANTVLVGTMIAGNSNTLLIPSNITEHEYNTIAKLEEVGVKICEVNSKYTALGNLILANDKGAIISDIFEDEAKKQIEKALGVNTIAGTLLDSPLVGTMGMCTNRGCLVHPLISSEEIGEIGRHLKVETDLCTVNRGIPYPKVGIIANSIGASVGTDTTGPESMRIFEVLLAP